MRALVQRVTRGSVSVNDQLLGSIGPGLVVLIGVGDGDAIEDGRYIVDKVCNLRIFSDDTGKFNHSALDLGLELLVISQFTLHADTRKGRRPGFTKAAPQEVAQSLFQQTLDLFRESGLKVETGKFQEHMAVEILNNGPVTIMIDSADRDTPRRG